MTQKIWTDQELQDAAKRVREELLNSVPLPSQYSHEFSLPFQVKMEEMKRKAIKRRSFMSLLTKIAAILLAVMLGTGIWAHISPDSWAAMQSWVTEFYENSVIYRFLNPGSTEMSRSNPYLTETAKCHIGWLPNGYEESDDLTWADVEMTKYENEDGNTVYLSWFNTSNSSFSSLQADNSSIHVLVGGAQGVFIAGESNQNELTWITKDGQLGYQLSCPLPMETMIKMAKSIC